MTIEIRGRTSKASCGHTVKVGERYISIPTGSYMGRAENRTYCLAEGCGKKDVEKIRVDLKELSKQLKALDKQCTFEAIEEDIRRCHLCDSIEENKWCVNTTCSEYTKHI